MDHAFILPLPQTQRAPNAEEDVNEYKKTPEFRFAQYAFEKLHSEKMTWEEFFQVVDPADPALRIVTTKEGDNILHLAVLSDLKEFPKELAEDKSLLWKRNNYGLNPIEIGRFLKKGCFSKYIKEADPIPFRKHPGVVIENTNELVMLDHLNFLPHPVFENNQVLYNILSRTQKAKERDQIPPEKTWMGIYFDSEIQEGTHPPVSVRYIDEEVGFGVFAEQRIPPCSYVGEYTGIIQERKRKHVKDKMYCVRYTVWEMGRRNFIIDAEKIGNFTRLINHSANPNLSLQSVYWRGLPRMIFIALKEIEEGTQFTFDYGTFFWKECQQTPKLF